jgi:hypothetical protein
MSGNQLVINNAGPNPTIDVSENTGTTRGDGSFHTGDGTVPGSPVNSKYDRNEKVDELYVDGRNRRQLPEDRYEAVVLLFWELYRSRIMAIAKKYRALSPVFDDDDLQQIGLSGSSRH